MTSDKVHLRFR